MNHSALLTAIMLHCGIPREIHRDVCAILADAKVGDVTNSDVTDVFHVLTEAMHKKFWS